MNFHMFLCLGPVSGVLCVTLNEPSYVSVLLVALYKPLRVLCSVTDKWRTMCYVHH